ncbi:hypothetical protein RCL1_007420 [Eukaryota sp. TZLM3-RCL]
MNHEDDFNYAVTALRFVSVRPHYFPDPNYITEKQYDVQFTPALRSKCIHFIMEMSRCYVFPASTCIAAISILDRYLSIVPICISQLQLLVVSSFFIAAKVDEFSSRFGCRLKDLCRLGGNHFTESDILSMEFHILSTLNYQVAVSLATPVEILVSAVSSYASLEAEEFNDCIVKPSLVAFDEVHDLALAILECSLYHVQILAWDPIAVACGSLFVACRIIEDPQLEQWFRDGVMVVLQRIGTPLVDVITVLEGHLYNIYSRFKECELRDL